MGRLDRINHADSLSTGLEEEGDIDRNHSVQGPRSSVSRAMSNKRKGSGDTGERGSTKKRRTRTAEEEEAERLRQEIAKLEAEIQGLEQRSSTTTAHGTVSTPPSAVSRGATKNRTHTPRSAPPPPQPTEVDVLWDDEDYDDDDEVDVGGFSVPSNGTSRPSRAKRTPRPSNRYSTFDTQLATEIDTSPSFSKRRTKSAKKPVLEAPEWKRILPQSTIPLSHRLMAKKQDPMNYCANLLRELGKHPHAWIFAKPVDPVALKIPDYFDIIKFPMDFSTVSNKLRAKEYASITDFDEDMQLIWSNAMLYNPMGSDVWQMTKEISAVYNEKFKVAVELDKGGFELKKQQLQRVQKNLQTEKEKLERQVAQLQTQRQQTQPKMPVGNDVPDMSPPLRPRSEAVSYTDKCQLCNAVNGLQDKYMPGVIKIFREETPNLLRSTNAVVEINTDNLDTMTLRRLEAYLNDCKSKDTMIVSGTPAVENMAIEVEAKKEEESSSSSSSGSSSSSDSSESSSDSDDDSPKHVLIMPSVLQHTTTQQPQTQQQAQPTQSQGVGNVNIDAWSMLNTNTTTPNAPGMSGEGSSPLPSSSGVTGLGSPKDEEGTKVDTKVWNDFKNMQAIQRQRVNDFDDVRLTSQERELKEVEEAKQQQLRQKQEEDMRLAQQAAIQRQWEEEERIKREKLEREQAIEREREAERQRRQQEVAGVNLMAQSELMAEYERRLGGGF